MSVSARAGRQCDHEGEEAGCPECRRFFADIVSDKKEVQVDTFNHFFVGAKGDGIIIGTLGLLLNREQALNLAAWLVVIADRRGHGPSFNDVRDAIERS